jgi:hypothetical protein
MTQPLEPEDNSFDMEAPDSAMADSTDSAVGKAYQAPGMPTPVQTSEGERVL